MSPTPEEALVGYVYRITNLKNGLVYIGQTTHALRGYFRRRIKSAMKGHPKSQAINEAIRLEGPENFECDCIEVLPARELHAAEIRWIAHYRANDPAFGYNRTAGGQNVPEAIKMWRRGAKNSPEHVETSRPGYLKYYETHDGPWVGRKHKPESIALGTRKVREYYSKNPSSMKGKKHSPQTIELMKQKQKSPEQIRQLVEAAQNYRELHPGHLLGRKHTPESKELMSQALKRAWKRRKEGKDNANTDDPSSRGNSGT